MTVSETFVREILSLYIVGIVGSVAILPAWVEWMMSKEDK